MWFKVILFVILNIFLIEGLRVVSNTSIHPRIVKRYNGFNPSRRCPSNDKLPFCALPKSHYTIKTSELKVFDNEYNDSGAEKREDNTQGNDKSKLINVIASAALAFGIFSFQNLQPTSNVMLLKAMEKESPSLQSALCNGKPTIIDFYADWCENCKIMAPTVRQLEYNYKNSINFVTVDGADPKNSKLVELFKVDGIPHFAFLSSNAELKTALVGTVPKSILNSEMKALAEKTELPYKGYNIYADGESNSALRKVFDQCDISS